MATIKNENKIKIKIKCMNEDRYMSFNQLVAYGEKMNLVPQESYDNGYSYSSSEPSSFERLQKSIEYYKENYDRYKGKKWLIEGFHFKDAEVHVYLIPSQTKKISLVSFS